MGLTDNFACLVVVAGHKSITTNNSYASSLDCGACGANPGGLNAKIFTIILNDKKIREGLIFKGISIPENTTFIAAEHNTVTNELEFLDGSNLSLQALENFELLKQDLNTLSNTFDVEKNKTKCFDWSQIRPEMGLCKNASFIIAPRNLTANINLDAKTFLHSYDPLKDPEGLLLEQILQGPLVVAEWINMQYFFSTYNNKLFGGGSKLSHNIVGNFGVMQGNLSDLMHGLSFESVYLNDKEIFHEPMRLQTFIYSDLNCVKRIFEKYENLKNLLVNEWIHVFVIDKQSLGIYQLTKDLTYSLQIEEKINYYEATV
jgi:uncharacterized protein YbcC (UPF0753/DUF2309 family)